MQRIETSLPDVWELYPNIVRDVRGFFVETYHRGRFAELGVCDSFVQENQSASTKGTLRGLHYQLPHAQAKLCRVIEGEAWDVAVDIRVGSPHFGKWTAVLLSARTQNQVYIPAGFAHGFLALAHTVQFLYKCSDFYDPAAERGIIWNDPGLQIAWEVSDPIVSEKDSKLPTLASIPASLLPQYDPK